MLVKKMVISIFIMFFFLSNPLLKSQAVRLATSDRLWMASIRSSIKGSSQSIRTKGRSIINSLKPGASGALKLYGENWFLLDDLTYLRSSSQVIDHIASNPEQIIGMDSYGTFLANTFTGGVSYKKPFAWKAFLGGRYFIARVKLISFPSEPSMFMGRTDKWIMPIIGGGMEASLCKRFTFEFSGDIGLDKNYLNLQITPLITWKITKSGAADIGYRFMYVQHRDSTLVAKSKFNGIFIGVRLMF
ncbi:TPA: hypothetical protein DEO28_04805 [Candidatus Dependentiae bacterium]|nr:MAG: hypothetical protein UR14_C0002G0075 [candidate division TM6 bacterium GW2011_GWE2_31_21]KKP53872.1 MAG: hypothetical protein UR43_C0002G0075 [candidate division TM6 bacterium GW2011_GWF2_33_332]HBS47652.1 hypothetical protein [Candidatus Dependentiae bacterium]HBZ73801.1 hypothetical protein [Candidatus Dependentiae bacterium]